MAVPSDPSETRDMSMGVAEEMLGTGSKHMKLTRRQKELNNLWAYFRVAEHDGKSVGWDGRPVMSMQDRETISRSKFVPPGYEMVDDIPKHCRKPIAPLGIVRNVVMRFTGLLFSNRRQPRVAVPGDDKTEDYLNALLEDGQFWSAMIQARNYGGATGSACVGYKFVGGRPLFEALDPRWVTPEFEGRGYVDPVKLTVQYTYSKEEWVDERWKTNWYWYRRVIDRESDTVWVPVRCREKEPAWDFIQSNRVVHNLGFVPYEWIQNFKVDDEIDGDPDCAGCYEMINAVDELLSEVYSGTVLNLDPTFIINPGDGGGSISQIKKGSDNAIKLGNGGDAHYMELSGSGSTIGITVMEKLEERIYRQAQCVPDSVLFQNAGEKTATEIERIFSSMFEKADALREQYGPVITRIGQKLLVTVRAYTAMQEVPGEDGQMRYFRGRVYVSPKVIQQADGDTVEIPRQIGKGTVCRIRWPQYQRPSITDQNTYAQIMSTILTSDPKLMTQRTAIKLLAPVLDYDPMQELHALKREEEQAAMQAESESAEGEGEEEAGGTPAENPVAWKTALENGIITLNEYREMALGLGEIPDGDLTMPQYRAKYPQVFMASTAAVSEKSVDVATGKQEADEQRTQESHDMKKEMHEESKKDRALNRKANASGNVPPGQGANAQSVGKPKSNPKRPNSAPAKKPSAASTPKAESTSSSASKPA